MSQILINLHDNTRASTRRKEEGGRRAGEGLHFITIFNGDAWGQVAALPTGISTYFKLFVLHFLDMKSN